MYTTYILRSLVKNWYYIGHTSNIDKRLAEHNNGRNRSTRGYRPFEIIYQQRFESKAEAFKREMQIKSYRHGDAFRTLIEK